MPTVCELKVQLKAKGIKGTSGFSKAQLQEVLDKAHDLGQKRKATNAAKAAAAPAAAKAPKAEYKAKLPKMTKATQKQAMAPLLLKYKEPSDSTEDYMRKFYNQNKAKITNLTKLTIDQLVNKNEKTFNLAMRGGTEGEKEAASRQFMIVNLALRIKEGTFSP